MVKQFSQLGEDGYFLVHPIEPPFFPGRGQRAKNRFRSQAKGAIGENQMNSGFKIVAGKLGKILADARVLERKIIDCLARHPLPANNPSPAKMTIPVVNHQRFRRRRGHSKLLRHGVNLNPAPRKSSYMCAMMFSPNAEHLISVAPGMRRAKS